MPTPGLIIVFLDQTSGKFKVCTDQTLQLLKTGEGVTSLGYVEQHEKKSPDGVALVPAEYENGFVPLLNFAVDIVAAKQAPKVELAESVPPSLTKKSRKARVQ